MATRWFLLIVVIMAICMWISTAATAGIVVEEKNNVKLSKTAGVITNIHGNKLTLKTDRGELISFGVIGESQNDINMLRRFKVGDRLSIEGGRVMNISVPQQQPLKPSTTATPVTATKIKRFDPVVNPK